MAKDLEKYQLESRERTIPLLKESREEMQLSKSIIDSLLDSFFDTGKLLLGFSLPALITVYSLKSNDLRSGYFWKLTIFLAIFGILLMATVFFIKFKLFSPYMRNTTSRMDAITALMESENDFLDRKIKAHTKKTKSKNKK